MSRVFCLRINVFFVIIGTWLFIAAQSCEAVKTELPRYGPARGLVGVWIKGMSLNKDGIDILEFVDDGGFRWLKESPEGKISPASRRGKYLVSGSTVTFRYEEGSKETESREFAIKGRTLLLRGGPDQFKNYGDPYWDYFYFRETSPLKKAVPSKKANVLKALQEKVSITGSLTMVTKDFRTRNSYGTYTTWTLDLTLTNEIPFEIDLGNTLIVAQLPEEGLPLGYVRLRGPNHLLKGVKTPPRPHNCYLLNDFDSTDGGRTITIGGAGLVADGRGKHPSHAGFGRIGGRAKYIFFEEFNPGQWLKDQALTGILVILPEFIISTPSGLERYQPIITLSKESPLSGGSKWTVKEVEYVPIRLNRLRDILTSTSVPLFKKILAINWMALADTKNAPTELLKVLSSKNEGFLLAACLNCYTQFGLTGLEKWASELEFDENAPVGIQTKATKYLDTMNYHRPGLRSISSSIAPDLKGSTFGNKEDPSLGKNNLVGVRFSAPSEMVIRRIVAQLGRADMSKLWLYSDNNGQPGDKVKEFTGSGEDFRGKQFASANQVFWLVIAAEAAPGWAPPFWSRSPRNEVFNSYSLSKDGGKNWILSKDNYSLQTTIYYTEK